MQATITEQGHLLQCIALRGGAVSFTELERYMELHMEIEGTQAIQISPNLFLWFGMSTSFADVVIAALNEGLIEMRPATFLVYLIDGGKLPSFPIAQKVPAKGYKKEHWLPVVFGLTEQGQEVLDNVGL